MVKISLFVMSLKRKPVLVRNKCDLHCLPYFNYTAAFIGKKMLTNAIVEVFPHLCAISKLSGFQGHPSVASGRRRRNRRTSIMGAAIDPTCINEGRLKRTYPT